jgi:hypothetical protein
MLNVLLVLVVVLTTAALLEVARRAYPFSDRSPLPHLARLSRRRR